MSLEQTVDNLEIRYANAVTFVGTSNTMIDTTTGRIQTKGIQHNSNVITDVSGPHGRVAPTLKKYPEIVFDDTSKMDMGEGGTISGLLFKQAGYTVTASSTHPTNGRVPYRAFNGDHTSGWICASSSWNSGTNVYQGGRGIGGYDGEWIKLELPHKIKVETMYIEADLHSGRRPLTGKLLGSDDDSTWVIIKDLTSIPNQNRNTLNIGSTVAYKYIAFLTETIPNGNDTVWIDEIEYYGYEEYIPAGDHSVDTTFMSRFNNPQLTGVQVLVDGATGVGTNQISGGPDPSGNQSTYVTDGKYWTLNGTLTSNLAVEANTFLEGDQPHAVSVWFNSSNLEANVSNTCVFSISDQEKLDSVNLDLQSNTWHNLTYAYQGEGGSRVTYLDGRKVAEDQAEDTFGEYPPFAMTGYSQGGYVVSASYDNTGISREAWKAFDDDTGNIFDTSGGAFSSGQPGLAASTGSFPGEEITLIDGTTHTRGQWLQLEFPFNFVVSSYYQRADTNDRQPQNVSLLGSNDNTSWHIIKDEHTLPTQSENTIAVNTTNGYKYLRYVIHAIVGSDDRAVINEFKYYGHRENDLVRLPDPTNVLKYPHIAMTGPAQRGYVASGSSEHSSSTFDGYNGIQEGKLFDDDPATFWHAETNDGTNNQRYNGTDDLYTGINSLGGVSGEWLKLQLPHKIILSKVHLRARSGYEIQAPEDFSIIGSNNDSTWYPIQSFTGESPQDDGTSYYNITSNPSEYNYLAIVIQRLVGSSAASLATLEFYGTGVDSVPIQIGGGNIDKVANFRVYDKFIDQNQALEIWDAQKDEFGRAKSSMTLQKGRLGIGTTEPEGRLAVADEPHNLEEFPPRAMTDYETYFEGHGVFRVSSGDPDPSDIWSNNTGLGVLFDKGNSSPETHYYRTSAGSFDSGAPGYYTGSNPIGGIHGAWVRIDFPYRAKIQSMNILTRSDEYNGRAPRDGYLIGKNDDEDEWTIIHEWTEAFYYQFIERKFSIEASKYYSSYALVATRLLSAAETDTQSTNLSRMNISEWRLFGTREQGQSVLHDGQLTLTKSLNVPRIGPALDADDTPRRDRLVVEYNTSTNPTFEGAVRDTSGRGNDGVFVNQTHYDATEKALVFDGTDDRILTRLQNPAGESLFSGSLWYKPTGAGGQEGFVWIGTHASGKAFIFKYNTPNFEFSFYGNDAVFNYTLNAGTWYHIAFAYSGGTASSGRRIWVNGVEIAYTSGASSTALNLDANAQLMIGDRTDNGADLYGSISNFKLYDTTLTAEEAKTLYDMGRCDEGHHVVNFSKTRVGIGLGDGEATRGALDVRGDIYGGCPVFFHATRTTHAESTSSSGFNPLIWQSTRNNKGGGYSTTTGKFTAPISGYYEFIYGGMSVNTGDTFELIPRLNNVRYVGPIIYSSADSSQNHRYGTATAIVYMNVGDTWHLEIPAGANGMYGVGNAYNMFTGKFLSY